VEPLAEVDPADHKSARTDTPAAAAAAWLADVLDRRDLL
jgi:hypothetical protein